MVVGFLSRQALTWVLIIFSVKVICAQSSPVIEFHEGIVRVKNIDREILYTFKRYYNTQGDWATIFPVTVSGNAIINISGTYRAGDTDVSFVPRFPFVPNVRYEALFHMDQLTQNKNEIYLPTANAQTLHLAFQRAAEKNKVPVHVTTVYPSTDTIPENILKFHIEFSTAMTRGDLYQRVKLYDESGKEIEKAFLILDQELWDNEMKIVTVMLDPGRVKRGLRPNLEMSTAIQSGHHYRLVVDKHWRDGSGQEMAKDFVKDFICVGPDRVKLKVTNDAVVMPKSRFEPLTILFHESLDLITLKNGIRIKDSFGNEIAGEMNCLPNERGISFLPDGGWQRQGYMLEVNPLLEDLAGNNFNRVFDRDLLNDNQSTPAETLTWPIKVSTLH